MKIKESQNETWLVAVVGTQSETGAESWVVMMCSGEMALLQVGNFSLWACCQLALAGCSGQRNAVFGQLNILARHRTASAFVMVSTGFRGKCLNVCLLFGTGPNRRGLHWKMLTRGQKGVRVRERQSVDPSEWSTSLAVRQHVSTTSSFPGLYVALNGC